MWVFLMLFVLMLLLLYRWKTWRLLAISQRFKSGLPSVPFLGNAHLFMGSDEGRMTAIQRVGQDAIARDGITTLWLGHRFYIVVADPEIVQLLLKVCLEKDSTMKLCAKMFIGNGSIVAPVHIWRPRRKVLISAFSPKNLTQYIQVFARESKLLVEQLRCEVGQGPFPIFRYISTYSLVSIFDNTLGVDIKEIADPTEIIKMMSEAFKIGVRKAFVPWLYFDCIFKLTSGYETLKQFKQYVKKVDSQIIKTKRNLIENERSQIGEMQGSRQFKPLLEELIESSGGRLGYTLKELREEFKVLIGAGTDTSAISTSFTLLMLAHYPDIQEKVYSELNTVFDDPTRAVAAEDLPRLEYLDLVIKETLRLYPPVPIIVRQADKDFVLPSGVIIPSGCGVMVNIWAVHRNPLYWGADAELFRPERFLDTTFKNQAQFMAFSHGPRNCVGYQYAMASTKTVLATILLQYRVLPPRTTNGLKSMRLQYRFMMKAADGFTVELLNRN